MEEIDGKIAKEAVDVLFNTEVSIVKKVPYTFMKFLIDNAAYDDEEIIIGKNMSTKEHEISDEAKAIISMVYRDFICSDEEKTAFDKEVEEIQNKIYEPFKGKERENYIPSEYQAKITEEKSLTKTQKWYDKVYFKIKSIFKTK